MAPLEPPTDDRGKDEKTMIHPFSLIVNSQNIHNIESLCVTNRSPVVIAEGQNILDAVLPTPSGQSDFSDLQIDSSFDFYSVEDVYVTFKIPIIIKKFYTAVYWMS